MSLVYIQNTTTGARHYPTTQAAFDLVYAPKGWTIDTPPTGTPVVPLLTAGRVSAAPYGVVEAETVQEQLEELYGLGSGSILAETLKESNDTATTVEGDVPGLAVTHSLPAWTAVYLEVYIPSSTGAAAPNYPLLTFWEGAVQVPGLVQGTIAGAIGGPCGTLWGVTKLFTPAAGAHTYKIRRVTVGGNVTLSAGATFPMILRIRRG